MKKVDFISEIPAGDAYFFAPQTDTGLGINAVTPFVNTVFQAKIVDLEIPAEGILFMLSLCVAFGYFIAFTFHFT